MRRNIPYLTEQYATFIKQFGCFYQLFLSLGQTKIASEPGTSNSSIHTMHLGFFCHLLSKTNNMNTC